MMIIMQSSKKEEIVSKYSNSRDGPGVVITQCKEYDKKRIQGELILPGIMLGM